MKLLMCTNCNSVFNLDYGEKECMCGETKGVYDEDGVTAAYSGDHAIPLAIDNVTLSVGIKHQPHKGNKGWKFESFVMPKIHPTFVKVVELP